MSSKDVSQQSNVDSYLLRYSKYINFLACIEEYAIESQVPQYTSPNHDVPSITAKLQSKFIRLLKLTSRCHSICHGNVAVSTFLVISARSTNSREECNTANLYLTDSCGVCHHGRGMKYYHPETGVMTSCGCMALRNYIPQAMREDQSRK